MDLGEVLKRLYGSEINWLIASFWDGGFTVRLGDETNGFKAESVVYSVDEAARWFDREARRIYPDSLYAKRRIL